MGDVSVFTIDGTTINVKDATARRPVTGSYDGLCPRLPSSSGTTKYLRGDGTWDVPPNSTYNVVSKTANGLCPQLPNETTTTKYLRQDGTWVKPPNTTYGVVSKTANGLCPQLPSSNGTTKYLRGDGTWVVPAESTYTRTVVKNSGGITIIKYKIGKYVLLQFEVTNPNSSDNTLYTGLAEKPADMIRSVATFNCFFYVTTSGAIGLYSYNGALQTTVYGQLSFISTT